MSFSILFVKFLKYNNGMKKFFYRVSKGDTATSIANKFKLSVTKLIASNSLYKEVQEGDILYIEIGEGKVYTVGVKDTLNSLSQDFGVSQEKILEDNGVPYIFYGLNIVL